MTTRVIVIHQVCSIHASVAHGHCIYSNPLISINERIVVVVITKDDIKKVIPNQFFQGLNMIVTRESLGLTHLRCNITNKNLNSTTGTDSGDDV